MPKVYRTDHNETWENGVLIEDVEAVVDVTIDVNKPQLSEKEKLLQRFNDIKGFLDDPDVQAALDQPNNTALPVATQNRFNKAMIRQERRVANMIKGICIYVYGEEYPELYEDIEDT